MIEPLSLLSTSNFDNSSSVSRVLLKSPPMTVSLHNKNILLGVCGGIAAYKSAELVRRLQDAGADVRVVMTAAATEFVTPLTFQALSGYPVHTDLLDTEAEAAMGHIELSRWADLVLVAPATANSIARLSLGRADDLLSAICLASQAPLAVAPAMNHVMWSSDACQQNIQQLITRGAHIFGPASGSQACGEIGEGRLLEPSELVTACSELFKEGALLGVPVLITAGPTYEAIDPVRYIGNRSSGKMGFAIAEAAAEQGAKVTLVAGPVHQETPDHVTRIDVESAEQMHRAVMDNIHDQSIFIASAAVADYRPETSNTDKIKKDNNTLSMTLVQNPDILAEVGALSNGPFTLGFAAETSRLKEYAIDKLKRKNLDMIAANLVAHDKEQSDQQDTGFNSDYNALQVFWHQENEAGKVIAETALPHMRKPQLARNLIQLLAQQYRATKE